ncbi:MAG: alpha-ketoglutarate-dependent dioxygenase AlkB [Leptospiraceae bacterium]|nr:alpha-ketoglutarate-dependent dioxygenase AlkB [Leptospiraceae bacterium]
MSFLFTKNISNLVPYDGIIEYYGIIFNKEESNHYFKVLLDSLNWLNDEAVMFGKSIITKRKYAWYGDSEYSYSYSKRTRKANLWTSELLTLKLKIEKLASSSFNSCLLNLYHSGEEGMAWHSDDEKSLALNSTIASVSLGAERKFSFKHKKTNEANSIILENGSLLLMKGETQKHWLHCIPKTKKITTPRINLTFRTML